MNHINIIKLTEMVMPLVRERPGVRSSPAAPVSQPFIKHNPVPLGAIWHVYWGKTGGIHLIKNAAQVWQDRSGFTPREQEALGMNGFDLNTIARFWSKIDVAADTNCWEWRAALNNKGYGRFKIDGKLVSPHRVAYEMANGPIEEDNHQYHGNVVMHICDNPLCCNPAHLKVGKQRDNVRDMARKHRCMPSGKISLELKRQIADSVLPSREAAAKYGVSRYSVMRIRGEGAANAAYNERVYGRARPFASDSGPLKQPRPTRQRKRIKRPLSGGAA